MKTPVALILLALAAHSVAADVTNDVDVTALSAFGNAASGETNGWFASHIDSYADGCNARLAEKGDYLLSPDFGAPVRRLILQVKSSSQADRRLAFVPWDGLFYDVTKAVFANFSPNNKTYVAQEILLPSSSRASKFKITLIGDKSTVWGLRQLTVVTGARGVLRPAVETVTTTSAGVIRLSSCQRGAGLAFQPNFAPLAEVTNHTALADGWFPPLSARALSAGGTVSNVSVNAGTTTSQGHFVWTAGTEGLGTYTATQIDRAWQWAFANDTGSCLDLDSLTVLFGQWNNRNSLPDALTFSWTVSSSAGSVTGSSEQPPPAGDVYFSTYTNNAPDAHFPALERRALSHPQILKPGETLTLTFRDTCPVQGSNAALGLAGLSLLAHPVRGTRFELR